MPQSADFRISVITGTTAGVTGGEIIPPEYEGVIRDISYAEVVGTGTTVSIFSQPSGTLLDVKRLAAFQSFTYSEATEVEAFGNIPRSSVPQVVTSVGNVVARIVYSIEYARYA